MFKSIRKSWDDHKTIKLKVGGTVFKAKKSVLTKYDGYFKTHFELDDFIYDRKGYIIIDRYDIHFKTILDFMKGKRIELPECFKELRAIYCEAHFYMLIPLMEMIEDHKKYLVDKEEKERKYIYGSSTGETPQNPAYRKYGTSSLPTSNDSDLVTMLMIDDAGELDNHHHHCSNEHANNSDTCPEPHNSQHSHTIHDNTPMLHHSHTTHHSDTTHYPDITQHTTHDTPTPYTSHSNDHHTVSSYEPSHSYSHADTSYSHTSYNNHSSSYDHSSSHNDHSSSYNNDY
ncbi:unnamed protein product [Caenorhabditis brenneri]